MDEVLRNLIITIGVIGASCTAFGYGVTRAKQDGNNKLKEFLHNPDKYIKARQELLESEGFNR